MNEKQNKNEVFENKSDDISSADCITCQSCGGKVSKTDKFCMHCGAKLTAYNESGMKTIKENKKHSSRAVVWLITLVVALVLLIPVCSVLIPSFSVSTENNSGSSSEESNTTTAQVTTSIPELTTITRGTTKESTTVTTVTEITTTPATTTTTEETTKAITTTTEATTKATTTTESTTKATTTTKAMTETATTTTAKKQSFSVTQGVLYEGYDTIIKTTGCSETTSDYIIDFYFENNSNLNLKYYINAYAVNGIMSEDSFYISGTKVASGKKATNSLEISKSWLEECGIEQVDYVDILFWAYDDDKHYKEFESTVVRVYTSSYTNDYTYSDGTRIYNSDGVAVYQLAITNNSIKFAVVNTSNTYFSFDLSNMSVNDWTYDTGIEVYDDTVLANCAMIYDLQIDSDFLNDNSISAIYTIEMRLTVRTLGSYFNSFNTGVIIAQK